VRNCAIKWDFDPGEIFQFELGKKWVKNPQEIKEFVPFSFSMDFFHLFQFSFFQWKYFPRSLIPTLRVSEQHRQPWQAGNAIRVCSETGSSLTYSYSGLGYDAGNGKELNGGCLHQTKSSGISDTVAMHLPCVASNEVARRPA
jgi:hypothetical protein